MRGPIGVEGLDQLVVPLRPEKGKGGEQGAGADTGHDMESGAITETAETDQRSGAKRTAGSTSRERQDVEGAAASGGTQTSFYVFGVRQEEITIDAQEAHPRWKAGRCEPRDRDGRRGLARRREAGRQQQGGQQTEWSNASCRRDPIARHLSFPLTVS